MRQFVLTVCALLLGGTLAHAQEAQAPEPEEYEVVYATACDTPDQTELLFRKLVAEGDVSPAEYAAISGNGDKKCHKGAFLSSGQRQIGGARRLPDGRFFAMMEFDLVAVVPENAGNVFMIFRVDPGTHLYGLVDITNEVI